ncbi:PAS domain S-box protein [Rubrobacter marinus]|uniref:PAS domain S-box protein n=1 Tax=Rubrobacter marinus TaxID=2653852 RepID=A0A6G8Q1J8_9ACTN|nr:PAS domain S-box protein [Rubrobacter marinus]QIN80290.1 PAS domain S-box protein [Rubrobacter marinus]
MAEPVLREGAKAGPRSGALPEIVAVSRSVSRVAGGVVAAIGVLVLAGWALDAEVLKRVSPDFVAMNPTVAVAFVLSGAALSLSVEGRRRAPSRAFALIVVLLGLLGLVEAIRGPIFGGLSLFGSEIAGGESGGMATTSAFCFALLGAALLLPDLRIRRAWPSQVLALAAMGIALLALIAYAFGASAVYAASQTSIALHSALAFAVLAVGVLCATPDRGVMEVVNSGGAGGAMARRLLPAVVLVPSVLGWLRLEGQRSGMYGTELGALLLVASSMAVLAATVWWSAWLVGRLDAERRLGESAGSRLAAIVESSDDAVIGLDLDGIVRSWNGGAEKLYGYAAEEIVGRHIAVTVPPDRHRAVSEILERLRRGGAVERRETVRVRKDGTLVDVSLTISPIKDPSGRVVGISTIARDFSERREAEEKLREAEARYRSIYENAAEGIFQTTLDGRLLTANPALARMTGYGSPEEMVSSITDLGRQLYADPEDRSEFVRLVRRDGFVSNFETRFRRRGGGTIWISMNARVLRGECGEPVGSEGTVQDVTERKEAEARYRSIFENAVEGIWQTTAEGSLTTANPMMARIFGYGSPEEMVEDIWDIGKQLYANPGEREEFVRAVRRDGFVSNFEAHVRRKDGSLIWISLNARAVYDDHGRHAGFEGTVQDVTERKKTEEALRESEQRFRSSFWDASIGMALVGLDGRWLRVNRALSEIVGYGRRSCSG